MSKAIQAWSTETTTQLSTAYAAANFDNAQLDTIAKQFNKTVPMVRSKLVSLKEYVPNKPRATGSNGSAPVRKLALVNSVAEKLELDKGALASFEKGSKADLEALLAAITALTE